MTHSLQLVHGRWRCGLVGIVGLVLLGAGISPNLSPAEIRAEQNPAASGKAAAKPRFHLTETSPERTFKIFDADVKMRASREIYPSGESLYFVSFSSLYKLEATDVAALVQLNNQLKGKKKSEAKEVSTATVHWTCINHLDDGGEATFSYSLDRGEWRLGALDVSFGEQFIPMLEQGLKDVEALKAVKPSVNW
jgi:hypothetical protein